MTTLGTLDALFLHVETAATPMHVGALQLLEPPDDRDLYAAIHDHLAARLSSSPVFTRQVHGLPLAVANPVWVDVLPDLAHHLQRVRVPAPGGRRQLEATVARLHAQRLDRDRPLWQFFLLEGLADGGCALYSKFHHAAIDGAAGVALAQRLYDVVPDADEERPEREAAAGISEPQPAAPEGVQLLADTLLQNARAGIGLLRKVPALARSAPDLLRAGGEAVRGWARHLGLAPATVFNGTIDGRRSIATASLPLARLRAIAEAQQVTINDVLLCIVGGALRRYLDTHEELPEKPLLAAVPVSLRERGDTQMNTQATMTQVSLATDVAAPLARLDAIHRSAATAKNLSHALRPAIGLSLPSLGQPWLLTAAAALYGSGGLAARLPRLANVVVSNVPGPPVPMYLAGARVRTWWPLSIVEHGVGLNITVLRYVDSLDVGVVAARCLVPDASPIAQGLLEAFDELHAAGVPSARKSPGPRGRRAVRADAPPATRPPATGQASTPAKPGAVRSRAARKPRGGDRGTA